MAAPEGYTELDLVGFTDKGTYSSDSTYMQNDLVHYNNKIYRSLKDNNTGQSLPVDPETTTEYWETWLSGGADSADKITAKDTNNIMAGGAGQVVISQALLDAITAKVINQISKSDIVQTESEATDKVPSSAYLKEIKDELSGDISELTSRQEHILFFSPMVSVEFRQWKDNEAGFLIKKENGEMLQLVFAKPSTGIETTAKFYWHPAS